MKIVKENLNEAIKHLSGADKEDVIVRYFLDQNKEITNFMYETIDDLSNIVNFRENEELIKSQFTQRFQEALNKVFEEYASNR